MKQSSPVSPTPSSSPVTRSSTCQKILQVLPQSTCNLHAGVGKQLPSTSSRDKMSASHKCDCRGHFGHAVTLPESHIRSSPVQQVNCIKGLLVRKFETVNHLLNNSMRAGPAGAAAQNICLEENVIKSSLVEILRKPERRQMVIGNPRVTCQESHLKC